MAKFTNKLTVGELRMFSGRLVSKAGESFTLNEEELSSPEVEQAVQRGWIEQEVEAKKPEVAKPVEVETPVAVVEAKEETTPVEVTSGNKARNRKTN